MTDTADTEFQTRQAERAHRISGLGRETLKNIGLTLRKSPGRSQHVSAARQRASEFGALIGRR